MRLVRKARRSTATALAVAVAALAAGCAGGTPASGPASAHPVAATASTGAGAAGTVPPVFAASLASIPPKPDRVLGDRLALLSSRTGDLLRWLTPQPQGATDGVLSVRDGWVYFISYPIDLSSPSGARSPAIWRVRVTGGRAQLVQAGASDYAVSPDGRAVASVISADHGDVVEVVARNLVTGRQNTIIMATKPSPGANNWPPGVLGLTWAPDDVHLAVQFQLTAAINTVLVFNAFTATAIGDGRTAPTPCTAAYTYQCEGFDPAYLASGALSYVILRLSRSGAASASLVAWQAGHLSTLLSFAAGASQIYEYTIYDLTAQGQAIWAEVRPGQSWTIWRWSGGAPVQIIALPPYYGVGGIAW
ncbi:MAG TPA: hypothetical protein VK284_03640 [Streptosporangiaceae bacterium]|nr:hypothetical protein [Streptosporangiaceae bacterium]